MSYMKWVAMIREGITVEEQRGKLGIIAATSGIQEYRLRDWINKRNIDEPSYGELAKLHDVLAERVILEAGNVVSESEEQRAEQLDAFDERSKCQSWCDPGIHFDESD